MSETLATYTLEVVGPNPDPRHWHYKQIPPSILSETEENLTDLLPDGYSVRIREWSQEKENPHE